MLRKSLAALFFACLPAAAYAGDKPLYQPAPAWIVPAADPAPARLSDADAAMVIFDQQQRVNGDEVWAYTDQATRIGSSQALREAGTVVLPWQPDAGDLIVHRAEILRGGERIDLIAAGQRFQVLRREEQLEQWQVTGRLSATLTVEGLRVGDVLRLSYSVTERDKALKGNVQTMMPLIAAPMRVGFARARISWPVGTELKWRTYADGLAPKAAQRGGFNEVDIVLPLAKPAELPADAPLRFQKPPIIEASSFADWAAVSSAMAPLYDTQGQIASGSPLIAEVAKIAAKSADPRTRAALALRLVQDEVRYLFSGMDGGNYIPQSPAKTWSLRYGDCKAKTLLLLAILHELGIEAEPVVASVGQGDLVAQRLPSAGAFDHIVVRATVGGKTLWLDGTGGGTRLEDLEDTPPFRTVLPLRAGGAALMSVAMHAPGRPMGEIDLTLDQSAGLSLPSTYAIKMTMRGQMAEIYHAAATQATREQREQLAQVTVDQVLGDGLVAEHSLGYDAETATATLSVSGVMTTPWKRTDGRYRMVLDKTIDKVTFEADRARAAWKDIPVVVSPIPLTTVFRLRERLPDGGVGFEIEGDRTLPAGLGGGAVDRKVAVAKEWVTVEDRVTLDGSEISPTEVAGVRAQISLAKNRLLKAAAPAGYPPRWKVVREARRTNSYAPILAMYEKAIALDTEGTTGYLNRANFYAGIWDWKHAEADLGKVIGTEPSAELHFRRANIREMLGDDKGALADAQAGLGLDPGSTPGAILAATLRFRAGERDAALASLAERVDQGGADKMHFVSARATLLAEAGRTDEAIAAFDEIIAKTPGNATLLNGRCWLKGTKNVALDTALKDCTKGIELAENPASIYDSRALVYFRMGRMEEALADIGAALELSPDQGASIYLRGVIRKRLGDAKGGEEDLTAARIMSAQVDADYARYGIKP